ncbi:MAG: hypothetical protein A2821_04320 [Candidatus Magasanikbacteria bacterium RIFCSPHIGHO2_01_FULL_41_23]|uniref:Polymerase nucleotidyl transferase domain-containing protein n=1 Tax=Candidatus Magasanikbacteria bacterium RIFCSPLOWO2_01_FULL_40_15 TaxID=1798686 RepID=A0A1F6N4L3_9BACT|nr:MAG: hypothetical protein A2821_04320 [Candidatus Magasanikbacteria bacterium RIFCSPHIGHO2_01_FULL_41_23]OGH67152.1 MAG: hypothetical protein A3C66_02635 [Candidatus Magasanikbacteria bacterium RIFCSPHIGHO2_02_FULL_41_35]OGH76740.1 MAG: hypothetical protein A3F22_03495 [Candidatus Magasanikbacteria bacterium RIFCSPHIGHO2_12_FULL_41_16]OGH78688.1 MAG: hypothetical protein A2983_04270 [Candidatus Magasanikbacteria bacterium RIFCSPLOWO2_01_FULL_40_15]
MKKIVKQKSILTLSDIQAKARPVFVNFDVKKAHLFGSYARGEATSKSDIDIIIEFKGQKSLFDLVGLRDSLQEKLGRKVDVGTPGSIHPALKKNIEKDFVALL